MPISRNRRKKPKDNSRNVTRKGHFLFQKKLPLVSEEKELPHVTKAPKRSFLQLLYDNEAEGLYRLVTFSPFFLGSWLAGGLLLKEIVLFVVLSTALLIASNFAALGKRKDIIFIGDLQMILVVIEGGLLVASYYITDLIWFPLVLGLTLLLTVYSQTINNEKTRAVLLSCVVLVVQMSLFAVLGIVGQTYRLGREFVLSYAVFGYVPGMVLASAFIARHSEVFLRAGWQRSKSITKKDGTTLLRPRGITIVFSLFLLFGPALPIAGVPFGLFPLPFLLCALLFVFIPKIGQPFLEQTVPDRLTAVHTATLAAGTSLLMFVAGMLAKYNVL